jgi:hypothetical protein
LLSLAACIHIGPLDQSMRLDTGAGAVVIAYGRGDEESARLVKQAAERATGLLSQWGTLAAPVELKVLPSHEALEAAAHRSGYGWLRAWARYREVLIQSPRTWAITGTDPAAVDELIAHELTHCLMYQLAATEDGWHQKGIPLWFREGMASVTAQQGYRRATLEALQGFYEGSLDDPLTDAESLYGQKPEVVYGAAHQAFVWLVGRFGQPRVKAMLARMREGPSFDAAFAETLGLSRLAFERQFRAHVLAQKAP